MSVHHLHTHQSPVAPSAAPMTRDPTRSGRPPEFGGHVWGFPRCKGIGIAGESSYQEDSRSPLEIVMSPQPLTLTSHPQRPWRPVASSSQHRSTQLAKHTFAAPVVRELPPRREARAAAATW